MAYFPMFMDIKDKKCLVIGGGKVAGRKIGTLLSYGADVRVISPKVSQDILNLFEKYDRAKVPGIQRDLPSPEDLEREIRESVLVVAASSDREANHQAAVICHRLKIPVNVVDEQSECTFFFPAVVKKGDISIGINTGGSSPLVSARIRKETEENVPDYYGDIASQLGRLREGLKEKMPDETQRRRFLEKVAAQAFAAGRPLSSKEISKITGKCEDECDTIS